MTKRPILLMLTALFLVSCGEPASSQWTSPSVPPSSSQTSSQSEPSSSSQTSEQTEEILLFNRDSKLIGTPKMNPENPLVPLPELEENMLIASLPTYHRKGKGMVPYVNLADLPAALNLALGALIKADLSGEAKEDGFHLYATGKKGELLIDAKNGAVKTKNGMAFGQNVTAENNGIEGDYISFRGNSIRPSEKTKAYKADGSAAPEVETIDLAKYGFEIYEEKGVYYAPLELMAKLIYRDISIDLAYNGVDFYLNTIAGTDFAASRIFSSKGWWRGYGCIWQPTEPGQGEAYRFGCSFQRTDESGKTELCTKFMRLFDNGQKSGKITVCRGDKYDESAIVETEESAYDFGWKKDGNLLRIRLFERGQANGDYWCHLDETYFLRGTIPAEVSSYNYGILRLLFDHVYGLRDIKNYTDAEDYFASLGVKEGLQSTDSNIYNDALAKLIGAVDDGHSALSRLSTFTRLDNFTDLADLRKKYLGPRLKELTEKSATYTQARVAQRQKTEPGAPSDPNYYQGMRISSDKSTLVVTFDGFMQNSAEVPNMKELFPSGIGDAESTYESLNYTVRGAFVNNGTTNGMNGVFASLDALNKNGETKNVVFDLTCNGGGAIATLAYLAAFFTDDPAYVLNDINTGTTYEYHYKVDINGDGVFGGAGDTYKGKYNFYFLTSGFSFSCGNCLPGMGKDAGCKIIGERSGGGASPVGVFMDALGSDISLSNYRRMTFKGSDGKYAQNDAGIPLDYEFPLQNGNWYDPDAISTFIKTLK